MAETASHNPHRERYGLSLATDVQDWMNSLMRAGGYFANPSHAAERALDRLRLEMDLVREHCRSHKQRFDAGQYWRLHAAFIDASAPGAAGRPVKGETRDTGRARVYASVANDLVAWSQPYVEGKPFHSLSHAIETGLRILQASNPNGEPVAPDGETLGRRYESA